MVIYVKKMMLSIIIALIMIFIVACNKNKSAYDTVSDYLDLYKNNDNKIMEQLNDFVNEEELTAEQKDIYLDAIKREYQTLEYEMVSERYDEDYAYVVARVTVLNLNQAQRDAYQYFVKNEDEFKKEDGSMDIEKYTTYKLTKMKEADQYVTYDIDFQLKNNNGRFEVMQLNNEDLEKIHGIYSYN